MANRLLTLILLAGVTGAVRPCQAQTTAKAPKDAPYFVDVNLAGASYSNAAAITLTGAFIKFGEVASYTAAYPVPSRAAAFPIEGGVGWVSPVDVGVGLTIGHTTYHVTPNLTATIPNPYFYAAPTTASALASTPLSRTETSVHASVVLMPLRSDRSQIRIIFGPSWFRYRADMVETLTVSQTADPSTPQSTVTVTGLTTKSTTGVGAGFHVGGEWTRFFNQRIGIAAGARYERGTVALAREPLSTVKQRTRSGGARFFVGLRFRLG